MKVSEITHLGLIEVLHPHTVNWGTQTSGTVSLSGMQTDSQQKQEEAQHLGSITPRHFKTSSKTWEKMVMCLPDRYGDFTSSCETPCSCLLMLFKHHITIKMPHKCLSTKQILTLDTGIWYWHWMMSTSSPATNMWGHSKLDESLRFS